MDKARFKQLKLFGRQIKYGFKDKQLLNTALTHKSYAFEHLELALQWNERLELFGDSILGFVITEELYRRFRNLQEGDLTKLRAQIVCAETLKKNALRFNIGNYLLLGKGEELSNGRLQSSNISAALEAVIGAVYLDRGIKAAQKFILEVFKTDLLHLQEKNLIVDYKSTLQELSLKRFAQLPVYELVSQKGPAHKREFVTAVKLNGQIYGIGWGLNRKSAKQMAAKEALEKLKS